MIRLRLVATVMALGAVTIPLVPADETGEVRIETEDRGTVARVTLPGKLESRALPRTPDGGRVVVVLVGPATKPKEDDSERPTVVRGDEGLPDGTTERLDLYRFDLLRPGSIDALDIEVPEGTAGIVSVDLDGDGRDEVLLAGKNAIHVLEANESGEWTMRPEPLLVTEEIGVPGSSSLRIPRETGRLCMAGPGSLRCYGQREDPVGFGLTHAVTLPVRASQRTASLSLWSPAVMTATPSPAGQPRLATAPEPYGNERLRTYLIDLEAPDGGASVECWSRFPGSEELMDFEFLTFGHQTALAVANRRADKLSFLGEKLLRVYFPEPDRTRRGRPPAFAVESRINLWQSAEFMALDVTGDDRRDLVVGYWKGLKKDRVVLDVYARKEDGGFEETPRTTALDIKKGDRGFIGYGHDLTGDGLYDLVVVSQKNVLIFPGKASPGDGSDLVASKPLFAPPKDDAGSGEVEIYVGSRGSGELTIRVKSRPRIEDLDGDGRAELLLIGKSDEGNSVLTAVRLD